MLTINTKAHQIDKQLIKVVAPFFVIIVSLIFVRAKTAHAASCTAPATDYGSVTMTVPIPSRATYRVWTRVKIPDTANKTFLLEVDGNSCYSINAGAISPNTWDWIDYQNGNANSHIDINFAAGNHTIKAIGTAPNVGIDKLMFYTDLSCKPVGKTGDCQDSVQPYDNKVLLDTDGTSYYVEGGRAHYIDNAAIRDCVTARHSTGSWVNVDDTIISNYNSSSVAYCNYEQEPGLNFIRENNNPTVWLVRPDGTKQHVGSLCVVDAYTTIWKKFRVHVVPYGETAGHIIGPDFFGNPTICAGLPG